VLSSTLAFIATWSGSAIARNFSISNRQIRVVWTPLTWSEPFNFFNVRCNVTLEGSLHSNTIAKVIGSLIGYITRAAISRPCTGGEAWFWNGAEGELTDASTTLPWHLRYQGFTGTLPNISTVRISLHNLKLTIKNGVCLGTYAPASLNFSFNVSAARTATLTPGSEVIVPIAGTCPETRHTGTSNTVTLLGTTTAITLFLI